MELNQEALQAAYAAIPTEKRDMNLIAVAVRAYVEAVAAEAKEAGIREAAQACLDWHNTNHKTHKSPEEAILSLIEGGTKPEIASPANSRAENSADMPMADGSDENPMSAAEEVLVWLLIEKIGVPDDVSYTPNQAQKIIEAKLDEVKK